jgi:hypothetical protein
MVETIRCAAIWVDTGSSEPPRRSYSYPATGLMFCGWRHSDCFLLVYAYASLLPPEEVERLSEQLAGVNQGFMTSTGRFVDRREAWTIAEAAGQILPRARHSGCLYSEDIY